MRLILMRLDFLALGRSAVFLEHLVRSRPRIWYQTTWRLLCSVKMPTCKAANGVFDVVLLAFLVRLNELA